MPAQKRPLAAAAPEEEREGERDEDGGREGMDDASEADELVKEEEMEEEKGGGVEKEEEVEEDEVEEEKPEPTTKREEQRDSDGEDGQSPSSSSGTAGGFKEEFILVKLADIRKEVQCPICLGIIRKTRTVMECLHRFCRECIDKSMRLGNNECPACRTHCASRRSLRDDPNYDALIGALYPDIDKYEEEELAFHEEDTTRNRKIQASIAETLRRQTEALGKRRPTTRGAGQFMQKSFRRGRSRSYARDPALQGSSEDEEDVNVNEGGKDSSSTDEPSADVRSKRLRRWPGAQLSPALAADGVCDENDDAGGKEIRGVSPSKAGNNLVWGKGGVRSQTRHGSGSSNNGKNVKVNRITKLVEYLRNLDESGNEFDLHLTLVPLDKETIPSLERPYLCCRPTLSIRQICQFIEHQTSVDAEEIEILARKRQTGSLITNTSSSVAPLRKGQLDISSDELQLLNTQESLAGVRNSFSSSPENLVLVYRAKTHS